MNPLFHALATGTLTQLIQSFDQDTQSLLKVAPAASSEALTVVLAGAPLSIRSQLIDSGFAEDHSEVGGHRCVLSALGQRAFDQLKNAASA